MTPKQNWTVSLRHSLAAVLLTLAAGLALAGIAHVKAKWVTLSFSASGNEGALDRAVNQEKHSPYAAALAYMLTQPGQELTQVLSQAGNLVEKKTQGKQHPHFSAPPNTSVVLNPAREMTQTRRVALLIGNYRYQHFSPLATPGNDVRLVAAALKQAGFAHVQVEQNLRETLNNLIFHDPSSVFLVRWEKKAIFGA